MHKLSIFRPFSGLLLLVVWSLTGLLFTAQAQDDAADSDEDEIVVLSPFVVQSSEDVGYLAQNTLAGSRLNTSLKDTGAAVSVLTTEFLEDLGATSMKDVILFSNNSVPDYGDAAPNYNGNPMIGNEEWLVRIRGHEATYMRNYWKWETSSDFYNVERIDQSRGPNSILFGFGAAGGIVNTTTKQAKLYPDQNQISLLLGSWDRYRAALDWNQVIIEGQFAIRANMVAEDADSWRQFENYKARRLHLASTGRLNETSTLKFEFESGEVEDNVARTWLAIDQAWQWRIDGRPTYDSAVWDWPTSDYITQTWSPHVVYVANDGSVMDWQNMPYTYMANQSWTHLDMTSENLAIIPRDSNLAGPGAMRETDYITYGLVYENQVSDEFSFEIAYNHQENDFLGFDSNAGTMTRYGYLGDATNIWGDASNWLPTWDANPYAGQLYVENNWTRRTNWVDIDNFRATAALELDFGAAGRHNLAGMLQHTEHDSYGREEGEVWLGAQLGESWDSSRELPDFDSNRVFRRNYFEEGNASDIHVPSWETPLTYTVGGATYESGWVPNQEINSVGKDQDTFLLASQSYFFNDRLVAILGWRHDAVKEEKLGAVRNSQGIWDLDRVNTISRNVDADTTSIGAVFHATDQISVFVNTSNNRNLPNINQRIIGMDFAPLPKGIGSDFGLKLDLFEGKLYATIGYYKTDYENTAEWGNIGSDVRDRNTTFLTSFFDNGLITAAERDARLINANSYLQDRKSKGFEFEVIANPTNNWRITLNLSTSEVIKDNIMNEVVAWASENTAYWLDLAGADYNFGGGDWDTLSNHIGWMMDGINGEVAFNGRPARGERSMGGSLYTHYTFDDGPLEGFSIGGGTRYQDANTIDLVGDQVIKGEDLFLTDMVVGYKFTAEWGSKPVDIDLQLNISNLFDDDTDQIYTVAWWSSARAERIGLQEPRKLALTARISF